MEGITTDAAEGIDDATTDAIGAESGTSGATSIGSASTSVWRCPGV
ncbi:MAG: hypothetical protein ACRDSZ_21475 [Pseudonocardiaceae bacterium]